MMKIIGVTGGIGSGKSELLHYIEANYNCRILMADAIGHDVMRRPGPGTLPPNVYREVLDVLETVSGEALLTADGEIDREEMAARIFREPFLRGKINGLIHPAVRCRILSAIDEERRREADGDPAAAEYIIVEAALLIESGYTAFVDEVWYIYCDPEVRAGRLEKSRGYSREKIRSIMASQLSEEAFRAGADVVIDNSGSLAGACRQVDRYLGKTDGIRSAAGNGDSLR